MLTSLIISAIVSGLVAIAAYVAVRRAASSTDALRDLEAQLGPRLDRMIAEVNKVREETNDTIQKKTLEMQQLTANENRAARKESRESLEAVTKSLTERFEKLQDSNEKRLELIRGEVEKKLSETLKSSGETFKDVLERLSELRETNQRIVQFSKELTELQSILQAPKLRGELGEMEMERMLRDCLVEEQYALQYTIAGGRVDAVIKNPEGILPIDSKFPLEAWRRLREVDQDDNTRRANKREFGKAVRKHIDDIAGKYIRPPETLDFAVMYVPAEGVYYELIENPDLMEYASKRRVFPASPMTFWALLQVTVIGFRGLQISENAKRISGLLDGMRGDMEKFKDAFRKASTQVKNASNNMDEAREQLEAVDSKLISIRTTQLNESAGDIHSDNNQLLNE